MPLPSIAEYRPWPYRLHGAAARRRLWAGVSRLIMATLRGYRVSRDVLSRLARVDGPLQDLGLTPAEVEQVARPRWDRF